MNKNRLIIEDDFILTEAVENNQINFMTQSEPDISQPGVVRLNIDNEVIILTYDTSDFSAAIEELQLTDQRLSNSWGEMLYRLSLNASELRKKGKYRFVVELE